MPSGWVCAFWPVEGVGDPPPPQRRRLPDRGAQFRQRSRDTDLKRLRRVRSDPNAFMVTMQGGPHVIWGRGAACPDKIVFGLMLDGRKPEKREQICKQDFPIPMYR